jgi:hypothetical protein
MVSYLATAILSVGVLSSAPQPLHWEASYGKALEATRSENTPLLIVIDKPNCKKAGIDPELLEENVIGGEDVDLLRPYQLCRVDVTTRYGKKVADAFGATRFPHVAIIDRTGSTVLYRQSGQLDIDEWESVLARHKSGERPVARTISRRIYQPSDIGLYNMPISRPSCPNCQRSAF